MAQVTMPWRFTRADMTAELETATRYLAEAQPGLLNTQRVGRAHLWLDEPEAARRAFAAGAEVFTTHVLPLGRGDNAGGWSEYGHLLRHAGDTEGAHTAYRRALTLLNRFEDWLGDELRYLLGEPLESDDGYIAQIARGEKAATRDQIVRDIRKQRVLPSYTAPALTLYDLLEETFDDPRPSHQEMLRRAGLLVD
jgi:hypothetical protein